VVDFINEVEEELRKDEYNVLLRRYGPYLLGVVIAIVAATGFLEWRKGVKDRAARATSAAFVQANDLAAAGDTEMAARQFLAIADKAPEGYAGISVLRAAAIELDAGNTSKAVALFDRAASIFTSGRHKQLAQLKAAYILANEGQYADVSNRIETLAAKDAPYEFLARELKGFVAMKSGDLGIARQEYSYLSTVPGVPETIQQRADQSLSLMKVEAKQAENSETLEVPSAVNEDVALEAPSEDLSNSKDTGNE